MPACLRLYIDTEFTSFQLPEGLSLAIVTDDGREFYVEVDLRTRLGGKLLKRCGDFVRDEVVSQFRHRPQSIAEPAAIGTRLADWLIKLKVPELEVVYDYSTDYELFERWLQSAPAAHKVPTLVPVHVGYLLYHSCWLIARLSQASVEEHISRSLLNSGAEAFGATHTCPRVALRVQISPTTATPEHRCKEIHLFH